MSRRGFHTITLGCKLNQFDSAAIDAELLGRGLHREQDAAHAAIVVINTCTVTARADADARKLIRRVRRTNPGCRLIVTGCYAELDPEAIRDAGAVDAVVGNRARAELGAVLDTLGVGTSGGGSPGRSAGTIDSPTGLVQIGAETAPRPALGDRGCDWPSALPGALDFGERSRAFLRIQEGCDLTCSYCIIPQVRGHSRSVEPAAVESAFLALIGHGYREVVLTGVNTGDYGRDLSPPTDLRALLARLLARTGAARIRLNSLEPRTVTDDIVTLMASEPRLAPHLQVPLQSGCDDILRMMRRNYRRELYRERLEKLSGSVPDVGLGADVIVGFPGETDERFEQTFRFVEDSPLSYLHVFSWSPRPGTPAASLDDRARPDVVRHRSARLRELGKRKALQFRTRFEGRNLEAVVLGPRADGQLRALTGNFIDVTMSQGSASAGELVEVRILEATPHGTRARIAGAC